MKKKFLSLMMAAAVVATTSVSAFADVRDNVTMPNKENVTAKDNEQPTQDVKITGHVQGDDGQMPATTFKVTVPTAANFTVTSQGKLVGPELTIKNEGPQGVDVYAYNFSNTGSGAIKVVGENTVANGEGAAVKRSTVSLKLLVDEVPQAYLGASDADNKEGIYEDGDLARKTQGGKKLFTLDAGVDEAKTKKVKIAGTAGKSGIANPVADTFKLVLKIKKAGTV